MKPHLILNDFTGSQTGLDFHQFAAGTTARLSDDLAAQAVAQGWAKEVVDLADVVVDVTGRDRPVPEGELDEVLAIEGDDKPLLAENRETKVIEPAETKPAKPLAKMSKAELVTHAMTVHGLELVGDSMTAKEMIAAIESAQEADA
jgi:hypothetical protein